jgi:hypothetical protein
LRAGHFHAARHRHAGIERVYARHLPRIERDAARPGAGAGFADVARNETMNLIQQIEQAE